ncbi:MAG: class I SAM-dependent methyltransferase [Gaiellaceae bacterium]
MSRERYRLSFEAVADAYERSRPAYAAAAVAWIAERLPFGRVLDLAAGTGKLTRQVAALAGSVVAVEPGDAMRTVLERILPAVEALAGSAEAIPLPDESVDAITVGQAFHWFRADEALVEMHRVLRPGGGVALLWNEWDEKDPLLGALDALLQPLRSDLGEAPDWRALLRSSPLFASLELRSFRHVETLAPELVVERIGSVSVVAAAPVAERERVLAEVRRLAGAGEVAFPMVTTVGVADRVS